MKDFFGVLLVYFMGIYYQENQLLLSTKTGFNTPSFIKKQIFQETYLIYKTNIIDICKDLK